MLLSSHTVTSNGIAIQYDGTFVPDEYVINNFEDTFTIICVGTEGNGQLSWFAETSGALEERFRNIRSQAGNYSGSFEFEGVQYTVRYSRNEARVTVSMVMPTYTETFKCYSSESFRSRRVVTTTGTYTYVALVYLLRQTNVIPQLVHVAFLYSPMSCIYVIV